MMFPLTSLSRWRQQPATVLPYRLPQDRAKSADVQMGMLAVKPRGVFREYGSRASRIERRPTTSGRLHFAGIPYRNKLPEPTLSLRRINVKSNANLAVWPKH